MIEAHLENGQWSLLLEVEPAGTLRVRTTDIHAIGEQQVILTDDDGTRMHAVRHSRAELAEAIANCISARFLED